MYSRQNRPFEVYLQIRPRSYKDWCDYLTNKSNNLEQRLLELGNDEEILAVVPYQDDIDVRPNREEYQLIEYREPNDHFEYIRDIMH